MSRYYILVDSSARIYSVTRKSMGTLSHPYLEISENEFTRVQENPDKDFFLGVNDIIEERDKEVSTQDKRKLEYPDIGEQLDVVYKALEHLKASGIKFPKDVTKGLGDIKKVKDKYPHA